MAQMEQQFENHLLMLRCTWTIDVQRVGTAHASIAHARIVVNRDDIESINGQGSAPKSKDATRIAMRNLWDTISAIPSPCTRTLPFVDLWSVLHKPIRVFVSPPAHWFTNAQVLGVDWEGQPRAIVQIACASGVYIDKANAPTALSILNDSKHVHCVFGEHEMHLVANPTNLQLNPKQSLAELASITLYPTTRLQKDKSIHYRTDWTSRNLSDEATRYAALDAELTRRVGVRIGVRIG
jgi:hypothetical protein